MLLVRRVAYFQELLPQFQGGKYEAAAAAFAALPPAVFEPSANYLDADGAVVTVGSSHALLHQQEQQSGTGTGAGAGTGTTPINTATSANSAALESNGNADYSADVPPMEAVRTLLGLLKPWKKGPLNLFGVNIDTEWR